MDDAVKNILAGKVPQTPEEMEAALDAFGFPQLPAEVKAKLKEITEEDLMSLTLSIVMQEQTNILHLTRRLQARCGACAEQGRQCAHCTADLAVLQRVLVSFAGLARFTNAAIAPGSRIAAQREARREQKAAEAVKAS